MTPDNIQLISYFITGYLISRLIIKAEVPQWILDLLMGRRPVSLKRIVLYLILTTSFLSLLIPNALTVLTILPLVTLLVKNIRAYISDENAVLTLLALSIIYGANIGGMGSITASAANGVLIGYGTLSSIAGIEKLTFFSWLLWGIPLIVILTFAAWLVLMVTFQPGKLATKQLVFAQHEIKSHKLLKITLWLAIIFFISAFVFSMLLSLYPDYALTIAFVTCIFDALLLLFAFIYQYIPSQRLLTISDCYKNLPGRGILFVVIAFVLAGIIAVTGIQNYLASHFSSLFSSTTSVFLVLCVLAFITSFSTEFLSNTVVQLALFTIIVPLSETYNFNPTIGLLLITLSSTCAFMSPIATGVNSLAFGELQGVSLRAMLLIGSIMNLVAGLIITLFCVYLIPFFV